MRRTPTRNIAVILRLHIGWDREVAKGIARYARTQPRWRLFIWPGASSTFMLPDGWQCHGAISYSRDFASILTGGVPIVYLGMQNEPDAVVVRSDERAMGRMAAEHLHEIGLRRLSCYSGSRPWAVERERGFRETAERLGAQYIPCPVEYPHRDDIDWTSAPVALKQWLRTVEPPLGLMGVSDGAARVASQACHLAGLAVPDQVAIIGVDNDMMKCELSGIALSSIDPAADRTGFVAAELLDRWLSTGSPPAGGPVVIPPRRIVRRRSTEVLAVDDEDVANALRFLREHALEPLSVGDIAEAACLARRTLEKRFKTHVGHSVLKELTRTRIRHACELLHGTDSRLDHIAEAAGFPSLASFHRVFRREIGRSPAGYRRWIRGEYR